jgi:hypothetical protein
VGVVSDDAPIDERALDVALHIAAQAASITILSYEEVIRIYLKEAEKTRLK